MEKYIITMPNNCIVKKNTARHSSFYKDKLGNLIARKFPITYYTSAYKEWAKTAIIACYNYRQVHPEIIFPLQGCYNLSCKFIFDKNIKVDITNLLEGVQDVLTGNAGILENTIPKELYQILADDSVKNIGSLDNCRFVYLPADEPKTIVTLTEFDYGFI